MKLDKFVMADSKTAEAIQRMEDLVLLAKYRFDAKGLTPAQVRDLASRIKDGSFFRRDK